MAKMTLEDLRKLRQNKRKELAGRETEGKTVEIVVGMATCGIAAGAKAVYNALVEEISALGMNHVLVRQTGCMGFCYAEPTVEVIMQGMPTIIYGKVDAATAKVILKQHVQNKALVQDHILDRPSADIMK